MDKITIGGIVIHRVEEWRGTFLTPQQLFVGFEAEAYAVTRTEVPPGCLHLENDAIEARLQSWVIETEDRKILFDTGAGNDKVRPGIPVFGNLKTPFLDTLARAGFATADIDLVVCSHLHIDHVGWNTMLNDGRWVPTFPKARYVFPKADAIYWDPRNRHLFPNMIGEEVNQGFFDDSVQPILDLELADLIEGETEIAKGIHMRPAPGHTPGSMTMMVESRGDRALFVGDVLHHPLQIFNPGWNSIFCEDAAMARASRRGVLERAADERAVLIPAHFAGEHMVRIRRCGDGFRPAAV
jgi:glyoxylase-like metal-dependent hydrolase (beta-lactamase superfamily II)